jgi:hypothetical protein
MGRETRLDRIQPSGPMRLSSFVARLAHAAARAAIGTRILAALDAFP